MNLQIAKCFACFLFLALSSGGISVKAENENRNIPESATRKEVFYKETGDSRLRMEIFCPESHRDGDKRAAIVFFFGGGWQHSNIDQFLPQAIELVEHGMVCILAEYRTKDSHGTSPKECLEDARSAIRYIRKSADLFGIDATRIAAAGGSAGGHLAAAAACSEAFDNQEEDRTIKAEPNLLILFNPVIDNGPDGGYGYDRVKEYYESFSPAHNIRQGLPPTLIMLGTKDKLVPVITALRYQKEMQEKGNICDLYLYSGCSHGFFNYKDGNNPYYRQTLDASISFLQRFGYIEP